MQMKKISILLLAAMALSISTTITSTSLKVYANSEAPVGDDGRLPPHSPLQ